MGKAAVAVAHEWESHIEFAINGERMRVDLSEFLPSTTLLQFIRYHTRFRAPKLGCGEGGCGACVVLLSKYDPEKCKAEEFSVASCLTLLGSINGCSVTTSEGLGNCKDGFHAIHDRIAGFHASQCGYCTPGMCMSIYAALRRAENEGKFDAERGHFKISEEEAEKSISGNLCRCTGYRPLADVCKSFAEDVDLEDLGLNSYWTKKELPNRSKLPAYNSRSVCTLPDFLRSSDSASAVSSKLRIQSNGVSKDILLNASYKDLSSGLNHRWIKPASLESLLDFLQSLKGGSATDAPAEEVKLVVGNTSSGYYKDINPTVFVDIKSIPELNVIHRTASAVEVGAAVTITKLIDFLENEELNNNVSFRSNTFPVAPAPILKTIADHLKKVASVFIRNTGSVGGNLIMAQRLSFDSDIATLLLGVGASVKIVSACRSVSILTMDEFLTGPCLETGSLLLSIIIPDWNAEKVRNGPSSDVYLFKTYRAAPRPLGNALAYVNAGFLVKIALVGHSSQWKIETARLAFGAFGTAHAVRAGTVERFLTQKVINCAVLLEAIQLLKSCVVPSEDTRNAVYRKSVAVGFLFDFFLPFLNTAPFSLGLRNTTSEEKLQSSFKSSSDGNARGIQRLDACRAEYTPKGLVVGKQVLEIHDDYHPVGQPTRKVGAELQASGLIFTCINFSVVILPYVATGNMRLQILLSRSGDSLEGTVRLTFISWANMFLDSQCFIFQFYHKSRNL